jgi:GH15 family glucan-1,4-alpha-glucosidase
VARELVIGNGKITIAFDNRMRVRDFFYPMVGLENHLSGHEFRMGVWTNNKFSWIGDEWKITMRYLPDTLVGKCLAKNDELGIELELNDAVHSSLNVYLKKMVVRNVSTSKREIRVLFSQDFHIYGTDTGDTAMYSPTSQSIIHYKRKRYFLINGLTDRNRGIYQFATGYKESLGREGTWKDAEDGDLQGNPIAQGSVDSVVSFKLEMLPESTSTLYYWIACGENLEEVETLNSKVINAGVEQLLLETENYWSAWVNKRDMDLTRLPSDIRKLFKTSLLLMRTHVDDGGAIIASCDSDILQFNRDTYSYVWPRDGALTALAFDAAGFQEVSRLFFEFCNNVISQTGFFYHNYLSDGSLGSNWHSLIDSKGQPQMPIQEDETALVILALWKHFQKYRDVEFIRKVYDNLVVAASEFLLNYKDEKTGLPKPSFDIWEEKIGLFTATSATVCSALIAAAEFAKVFYDSQRHELLNQAAAQMKEGMLKYLYDRQLERFIKAIYPDGSVDASIDSSLAFVFAFGPFAATDHVVVNTMNSIVKQLWVRTDLGGLARYENDEYRRTSKNIPGNPWFITTLWLARWYIAKATSFEELKAALDLLSWAVKRSTQTGILGEQFDPQTGLSVSVQPLIWSHAEFVNAVCEYIDKYNRISSLIER